jgi:tRNA(fMet)-specific endonuclease VapC
VAAAVVLDTMFLIDFQRERTRGADGAAHHFLRRDPELELHLSATALGEFAEGFDDSEDELLRRVRQQHVILPVDEETAACMRVSRGGYVRRAG